MLVSCAGVQAKEYPMLRYTVEQGLPGNTIYDVYQDKEGMIWIGTDKGIARFNGIEFKTFTTADGLADNECFYFRPDHYGRLWIGTFNGELCYYQNGRFHNPRNTSFLKHNFNASNTLDITVHADSSVTIFYKDNSGFIEIKGDKQRVLVPKAMLDRDKSSLIHIDKLPDGCYLLTYEHERVILDHTGAVRSTQENKGFTLHQYYPGQGKAYYLADHNTIYTEDLKPVPFRSAPFVKGAKMLRFIKDDDMESVAFNNGVYFDSTLLLPGKTVNVTYRDKEGNYWIGTNKDGICVLSAHFEKTSYWPDVYKQEIVFAACRDSFLFFATNDKSLYRLKKKTGEGRVQQIAKHSDYIKSSSENIISGWVDDHSFFSFCMSGVYRLDNIASKNPGRTRLLKNDPGETLIVNHVYANNRLVCVKTRKQLNIGWRNEIFTKPDSLSLHIAILPEENKTIYGAAFDHEGRFWFSSRDHIYYLDGLSLVKKAGFPAVGFREFIFSGKYFVGCTHNNELLITNNYLSSQVKPDTIKSNDCVWDKFYPLNDTSWLISTNNYFRILTLDHTAARPKYTIRLLEHSFVPYLPDFTYTDSNTCFFFKNGALSRFPVSDILREPEAPHVQFQELITSKRAYFIGEGVNLDYFEAKNISLLFTAVSYSYKNLSYEYSISTEGKPERWTEIKGNEIDLYKIGYGHFTVRVRTKTMSGKYGRTASFFMNIDKPYWATYWFVGACIPAIIFIVAFLARIGIKQALRRKERELRFLRSEYKALNALMNPHFIFNSLNSLQSLVNNNENKTASKYIRVFSDLIRQNMRNISQDLIPLARELDLVENYLRIEKLRFKEHLNYEICIDDAVETDLIKIPPLLIQPLVENAIKHGIWPRRSEGGFIRVVVYEKAEILYVEIIDNGAGFQTARISDTMHESYAMTNIHKRTQQLSLIHKININVTVEELIDDNGTVTGVKSLVSIDESGLKAT
jgi:hypothetical protein